MFLRNILEVNNAFCLTYILVTDKTNFTDLNRYNLQFHFLFRYSMDE